MPKYADYIKRIEIDSLWSGKKHIVWELNRHVNILSGMNGEGKSTILNKVVKGLAAGGEFPSHMLKGVRLDVEPEDAKWIRYDKRAEDVADCMVFALAACAEDCRVAPALFTAVGDGLGEVVSLLFADTHNAAAGRRGEGRLCAVHVAYGGCRPASETPAVGVSRGVACYDAPGCGEKFPSLSALARKVACCEYDRLAASHSTIPHSRRGSTGSPMMFS